ncbi:unnamed protein product [Haemonchus placei]|uniref:Secreted protein n=1 Tax=Haemonchus placei TaxID=6290 RepID=A0A0N4W9H6_HAEPC|nr:unnamed protein product [Haemonchus placei]
MRVSGAAWQLIPVWLHCISIVAGLVGIVPSGLFRFFNFYDNVLLAKRHSSFETCRL